MKQLDLASKLHDELDAEYNKRLFRAIASNHQKAATRFTELRRINDGAYFLIIFGTFERYVTEKADVAVRTRANKPLYRSRRAWETLMKGTQLETSFLNRVRVLLDQQSTLYGSVSNYYKVRNDLAHNGVTSKVFSIPAVVAELKSAVSRMKH